jgi:SAM-dependent methyltransferase
MLFSDQDLRDIASRYRDFDPAPLGYGTVRDYCDSYDHLYALATANGDLKDLQRPWVLKAVLGALGGKRGRVLEIGAGEPLVADVLESLGNETWIVDPYDGSGNGPTEYESFCARYPSLRFVRAQFGDASAGLPAGAFDCIYSISVLEHVAAAGLQAVTAEMARCLRPAGCSVHAVDHVHRGRGAEKHLGGLRTMTESWGIAASELDATLAAASNDVDTYYLSAESHNRWRAGVPYDEFPMRVCISIQVRVPADRLTSPRSA